MKQEEKAVIYARYSSHNQTERSIEGQLEDCYEYAKRMNLTVVGEYIDRAKTGTNDQRESFQRMISDCQKKQFSQIIVYKLDRFARNRYDSAVYKSKIKKYGVKVVSAMENVTDSPEGIILESVLEGMAEYYSANLAQNVKRGLRVAFENKQFTGGIAPFGYKIVNKKIEIDEKRAPIIQEVFKRYAEGEDLKIIVNDLNKRGIKGLRGKKLSINSFQNTLNNRKYLGLNVYAKKEVKGVFPQLIDEETFEKVQMNKIKKKRAPAKKKAKVEYILTGKAFCGHCGAPMVGDSGTGRSGTYYYYSCADRKKKKTCDKKREKKEFIEWYVTEQTIKYILAPDRIDFVADKIVEAYNKDFSNTKVIKMQNRIDKIDKELDDMLELALQMKNKQLTAKIDEKANILTAEKQELEIEISKLKIAQKIKLTKEEIVKWLKSYTYGDLLDINFQKKIIETFINSVYIYDNKIVIYYNISNSKQITYIDVIKDEDFEENEEMLSGSDFKCTAPSKQIKSETHYFFKKDYFGIVIPRK